MNKRLKEDFYIKNSEIVAIELLGKLICRKIDGVIKRFRITETECYNGEEDTACHANKGKTERTKVLYEQGGICYVYLCYGIHNLFNVVTGVNGHPEGVLIRGIDDISGPGRVTKALNIDRSLNETSIIVSDEIWIEDDGTEVQYEKLKRVGIDYATEEYRNKLWRFKVT